MSGDDRPGIVLGFGIRRRVEHRLEIAGLRLGLDAADSSSSSSGESEGDEIIDNEEEDEFMDNEVVDELIDNEEVNEFIDNEEVDEGMGNEGMMHVEGRDAYEEEPFLEYPPNLNNDIDRAEYVLQELKKWAQYGVSTKKIDEMLKILHPLYPNLPKSYKTLLGTPRNTETYPVEGGRMWYKGIRKNIEQWVSPDYLRARNEIVVDLNMDGMPPYKYSFTDCWPILGCLAEQEEPFVVAVYIGETKPKNVDEFLENLVDELRDLRENGIDLNGFVYPFRVRNYICDAPARSMIKCIVNHNSTYACERCEVQGAKRYGVMTFSDFHAVRRTDESFANRDHQHHHEGASPLENIGTGMVTQFVYDGLHLLHEGVFKRWLQFVLGTDKNRYRRPGVVTGAVKQLISETIMQLAPYIPVEFNRRSRALNKRAKYRATEYARLLNYDGLLAFRHLPRNVYKNYLLLHAASYILSSPELYLDMNNLADLLVQEFITHSSRMFGEHFVSYYVHCFLHFPEECARLGPLYSFSAYKYENYLGVIKRLLRSKFLPLQQIANRDAERGGKLCTPKENDDNIVELLDRHDPLDEELDGVQFYGIKFDNITLSANDRDCCFKTNDQDIAVLTNIIHTPAHEIVLIGRKFQFQEDFTDFPVPSSTLGIVSVSCLRERTSQWHLRDFNKKCVLLPIDQENSLCIPLLHSGRH